MVLALHRLTSGIGYRKYEDEKPDKVKNIHLP